MVLRKNRKSALILSAVTVLTYSVTGAILNILAPYLLTGDIHTVVAHPENLKQPASILALSLLTLASLLILTALGAFWLYRFFDEKYFGPGSVARWALFGFFFAVLMKVPDWILPQSWWAAQALLKLAGLFAAFFLARWLRPLRHKNA